MEREFLISRGNAEVLVRKTEPDFGDIRRVVLGVHGLGGSSRDAIQEALAEEMELFYAATLRFDLPCHGESPMEDGCFTLENCLDSLLAVAEYARDTYPEVEDLCIFASGFGAYLTLVAMDELVQLPGTIKLVVQTPSVMMHESLLRMKGISAPTLEAMGYTSFERMERPLVFDYGFYQDLVANQVLAAYPIPMLILHGEKDNYIKMEDVRALRGLNDRAKLVVIPGVTHRFLEEGAWDMVLDLTRDWFEFEQVLCCDYE